MHVSVDHIPPLALSVRQPWAWAIIHGGKDIENRSWKPSNPGLKMRGRIAIHASAGMTRAEYEDAMDWIDHCGARCPDPADLLRGGIIGSVTVTDVVARSKSPWFFGPRGIVMRDPQACDFIPAAGQLGYFEWTVRTDGNPPAPAKWMKAYVESHR